jgi:hypothetical protein
VSSTGEAARTSFAGRRFGAFRSEAALLLFLAAATAALWIASRGKWSDAIIDTGTEWIYADSLAHGDLLYRDLIYWFGPFTPYYQAAFLRAFGSGFPALVIAGIVGSLGTIAALYFLLRRVTGRLEAIAWTGLAIAALVFLPDAGGSILGMGYRIWHPATFTLIALSLASRPAASNATGRALAAGLLCGLAGLCRTEWGLIALGGVATAQAVLGRPRWARDVVLSAAGAAGLFFAGLGAFVFAAGSDAVLSDGHVLLTGISPETRKFLMHFSGLDDWKKGLVQMFYAAAMWTGGVFVIERIATGRGRRTWVFVAVGLVLVVSAALGGAHGAVLFSAAPLACVAAIPAGFLRRGRPRSAALASAGIAGLLAMHRRFLHIVDSPYVGPPLLFAFVSAAGLLHLLVVRRPGPARRRLRRALAAGLALLVAVAFAGRIAWYANDDRVAIAGTGGMVGAKPRLAREIEATAESVRRSTSDGDTLVVFPEGQIVNALSGRRNPLRQKLYIPGYLTSRDEAPLLQELARTRPRAIVVWPRLTTEYGPGRFGDDYAQSVLRWILDHYAEQPPPVPRSRVRIFLSRGDRGRVPAAARIIRFP